MLNFDESLELLKNALNKWQRVEKIAITQAFGRILAEDIYASFNYPAKETASMDGYAVKFSEQSSVLKVLGSTPAGCMPKFKPSLNECVKTMTGSLMSEGSDTLVPVENVKVQNDGSIIIQTPVSQGFAVRKVGESYKKGELLLKKGLKLDFSELALLAELGIFHISVFVRPVVGILSSGSEIKDLGECLENEAQIRSTNHIALATLARKFGCETRIFPLLKDDESTTKSAFASALMSCDILVSTGGVSMGDFDFLKSAVREYELVFDRVAIKPGRHIKVAKFNDKLILALPGFAYSAVVLFVLYMKFILCELGLLNEVFKIEAIFCGNYIKKSELSEFVACNLLFEKGRVLVNLNGKKQGSSAILGNLKESSALMRVESKELKNGDLVEVYLI